MRIAIVNDLALAQIVLRRLVESVPGYTVAWTALDGSEAVRKASADRPDAILMDLLMPVMDGAEATRRIMAATPCPILVVTASVGANFGKVYEALGAGGLDAVKTPTLASGGQIRGGEAVLDKLKKLERANKQLATAATVRVALSGSVSQNTGRPTILAIGASTGGPEAIARVLSHLAPKPSVPVIVVQHIAADFVAGLATWLRSRTNVPVQLAQSGGTLEPGQVYVAGSDDHLVLRADLRFAYTPEPLAYPYRPSVDVLFESLAANWVRPGVGILLTGMGCDGARGLAALKNRGWYTIAQDQATSVVFGMPRAAAELGAATQVLPLAEIGPAAARMIES